MMSDENQNQDEGESQLHASPEEMETLVLDYPSDGQSPKNNEQQPPPVRINYDPLLSAPSSSRDHQSPNSPFDSFLEPPSYAEAIFTSFDSTSNGHGSPKIFSKLNSSSSKFLNISVSDPQKVEDASSTLVPGGNGYFTYLIKTRTDFPEYGGPGSEFSVRRRFKDVVTLSDRLSESYRGFFIPMRPDKSVVESQVMQKLEFVEHRRAALEKYLKKLATHPVIRQSEQLRLFLEAKGKLPLIRSTDVASRMLDGAVKLPKQLFGEQASSPVDVNEVALPAKGGRDLLRIFKELKQSVSNDWGGFKPLVIEEDKDFIERKEKLMEFEQQLSNVSQEAESLVKSQQDIGEAMGELGLAFVKLTKFETEEAMLDSQRVRAADMKNMATAAVKSSRLYRELNSQTVKHLDKLHDYLGIMLAVNSAFSDRASALLTVQTLSSELTSMNTRIEKLEAASSKIFGGDRSRMRKIEELKDSVRITEDAKDCAIREYDRIKENNRSEFERLNREMHDDFKCMLRGFVLNQAGYAEKMANVWEKLAEETSGYADDGKLKTTCL